MEQKPCYNSLLTMKMECCKIFINFILHILKITKNCVGILLTSVGILKVVFDIFSFTLHFFHYKHVILSEQGKKFTVYIHLYLSVADICTRIGILKLVHLSKAQQLWQFLTPVFLPVVVYLLFPWLHVNFTMIKLKNTSYFVCPIVQNSFWRLQHNIANAAFFFCCTHWLSIDFSFTYQLLLKLLFNH